MIDTLLQKLDALIDLHRRNGDMWVDFFEQSREKILKDPAFGCEYLIMGWHGIGGYDDERMFDNNEDEAMRKSLHPQLYKLAIEIRHDQNKAA
jgi:hypothetical protein